MIENNLVYFKTRQAFENALPNIADSCVVFVEEGRTIYTHGVEFNADDLKRAISQIDESIRNIINDYTNRIQQLASQLHEEMEDRHAELVEQTQSDLQDAKNKLDEYREYLDSLDISEYKQGVSELRGVVSAYAQTWDTVERSVTTLSSKLDSVEGRILTQGEYADIANSVVSEYKREVNLKLATLEETLNHIDVEEQVETIIGREIDAVDGLLHDFATKTWVDQNYNGIDGVDISNAVETYFNTNEPSWRTFVSNVTSLQGKTLESLVSKIEINTNDIQLLTTAKDDLSTRIASIESWTDQGGAGFALTAQMISDIINSDSQNTIVASIIGKVNAEGSELLINADKINLLGQTIANVIAATSITASSLEAGTAPNNIIINSNGIQTGNNGFNLLTNGTGNLANRNIYWLANGDLYVNGTITASEGSTIPRSVLQPILGSIGSGTVKEYIDNAVLAVNSGESDISALVSAAVDSRVENLTDGYLLVTGLSAALTGLIQTGEDPISIAIANAKADLDQKITVLRGDMNDSISGLASQTDLTTVVNNLATNTEITSKLNTWASTLFGNVDTGIDSGGFSLSAFINDVRSYSDEGKDANNQITDSLVYGTIKNVIESNGKRLFSSTELTNEVNARLNQSGYGSAISSIQSSVNIIGDRLDTDEANITSIESRLDEFVQTNTPTLTSASQLKMWADSIMDTKESASAGFSLSAFVDTVVQDDNDDENSLGHKVSADIKAYVDSQTDLSTLQLSANRVIVGSGDATTNLAAELDSIKSGESIVGISADKIVIDGETTLTGTLSAMDAKFDNITAKSLSATSGNNTMTINANALQFKNTNGNSINILADGSGSVANGNISWDTNGNVTVQNASINPNNSGFVSTSATQNQIISIYIDVYDIKLYSSTNASLSYRLFRNGMLAWNGNSLLVNLASGQSAMPDEFGDTLQAGKTISRILQRYILSDIDAKTFLATISDDAFVYFVWPQIVEYYNSDTVGYDLMFNGAAWKQWYINVKKQSYADVWDTNFALGSGGLTTASAVRNYSV